VLVPLFGMRAGSDPLYEKFELGVRRAAFAVFWRWSRVISCNIL
jgi:hypothetical protein